MCLMMQETTKWKTLLEIQKNQHSFPKDCVMCSERKIKRADHETVYCGVPCPVKQELQKWRFMEEIHKNSVTNKVAIKYFLNLLLYYNYWVKTS